ncbi:unnamed protein product [Rhizophagus irregularis]|nr:unnamed protein product [Rhizophagus irregularis]
MWHLLHENDETDNSQKQLEINRNIMVKDTTKAAKLEKKLNITLAGYLAIQNEVDYLSKRESELQQRYSQLSIEKQDLQERINGLLKESQNNQESKNE